jgi:hypothetical protein
MYLAVTGIRDRVARLLAELPKESQYPTQGATVFVDLERREVQRGETPLHVVRGLLLGRGANIFYSFRPLDTTVQPLPLTLQVGTDDKILLDRARQQRPADGDRDEIIPTISGG